MKLKKGFEIQNVCGEHIIVPTGVENVDYSKIISLNEHTQPSGHAFVIGRFRRHNSNP